MSSKDKDGPRLVVPVSVIDLGAAVDKMIGEVLQHGMRYANALRTGTDAQIARAGQATLDASEALAAGLWRAGELRGQLVQGVEVTAVLKFAEPKARRGR